VRDPRRQLKRLAKTIVPVLLIVLATAVAALAATPKSGAYFGRTKAGEVEVEFSVPASLKKVRDLTSGEIPQYCAGGGIPTQTLQWGDMTIKAGKFSGKVAEKAKGQVVAHGTISGKFLAGGKVTGTLKSVFSTSSCSGQTTFTAQLTGGA
jgi:hypothetical protein